MIRLAIFFTLYSSLFAADLVLKPGNLPAVLEQARKAPKPVRIIVAFPPGGISDFAARAIAPGQTEALRQTVHG